MMPGTLARYFGLRFLNIVVVVFGGLFVLVLMVDYVEMLRRTSDAKDLSALLVAKISIYRVPFVTERVIPFAVLIGAMVCYLSLSRRLELVVARSAGVSAWQFVRPAVVIALLIGIAVTTVYNPGSAMLREQSERLEADIFGGRRDLHTTASGFWLRQKSEIGQSIVNATTSAQQGAALTNVTVFLFDNFDLYRGRIEAKRAVLHDGYWQLEEARVFAINAPIEDRETYELKTNLTRAQVQESFATPETVPFWQLSAYIRLAENSGLAAIGYRLQYYQLLMMPLYLVAMVLLAAAVSLRTFRFGGVQKMALSGVTAGFLLFVMSKVTGDLSKAGYVAPVVAAALPALVGGAIGVVALLYQEDG